MPNTKLQRFPIGFDYEDMSLAQSSFPSQDLNLSHINQDHFDHVNLGKFRYKEYHGLTASGEYPHELLRAVEYSALTEFTAEATLPVNSNGPMLTHFYFRPATGKVRSNNLNIRLLFDAFLYEKIRDKNTVIIVLRFFLSDNIMSAVPVAGSKAGLDSLFNLNQEHVLSAIKNPSILYGPNSQMDLNPREPMQKIVNNMAYAAGFIYIFTQKYMTECPELMVEVTRPKQETTPPKPPKHSRKPAKKQPIELVKRTYVFSPSAERGESLPTGRKVVCPFYTVRGHWRNYKSGKRTWIKPYSKGTERHNPEKFVAKEYVAPVSQTQELPAPIQTP